MELTRKTQRFLGLLLTCGLSSILSLSQARAQVVAFPGAYGFGAMTTGGRGGTVYHVTNLNDSGAGSFRDAVSVGNRIVVFDVGGYITLSSEVAMKGNITVAGQTAPGGGIGIQGREVSFGSQSNIIVRHVRFRPGSGAPSTDNCLNFYQAHNVILDHVSVEFASWNNMDATTGDWTTHPINGITVQNSIDADPIGQQFGAHTEAPNGQWSWFDNLFANSHNRNPLAKVNTVFINNALYNCDAGYTTHTSTNFSHDIVNNYFVAGPASGGNFPWYQIDNNQSMYFTGNLHDSSLDGALNGSGTQPLPGYQGGGTILTSPWSTITTSYPFVSAASAFRRAISLSGALPRDAVDTLVVSQAKTLGSGTVGTGAGTSGPNSGLYTSETQTGLGNSGFGTIAGGSQPLDTDNDGIPDYWEIAVGWNPNSADSMTLGPDGYDHLEDYVNWLADPHVAGISGASIDLDLSQFTTGFTSAPVFSVSSPVNGSVSILGDGHTARFVSNAGFSGLAYYHFTVTDSAGSTMTLTVGVLVQPGGPISTPTRTNTPAPSTYTRTNTPTSIPTATATRTMTPTFTLSSTATRTNTLTSSNTPSSTPTFTNTATSTATTTRTNTPIPPTTTFTSTPTSTSTKTNTPLPPTFTFTSTATNSATSTKTHTPVPPTATNTPVSPTATNTPAPPTATNTATLTTTNSPVPPTSTSTRTPMPPTATNTPVPPTSTNTSVPPSATFTHSPVPPTSTNTPVPPTSTSTLTPMPPTTTSTPTFVPPTATNTATSTKTNSPPPPTSTDTAVPPTATASMTPSATASWTQTDSSTATGTASLTATSSPTYTNTLVPPTSTSTHTPVPPTATLTPTPSFTSTQTVTLTPTQVSGIQAVIYPNPVTGNSFNLQIAGMTTTDKVDVQIQTTAFRKVNELTFHSQGPGTVNLVIPATDSTGGSLANGIYYVIVRTESVRIILKLMILR